MPRPQAFVSEFAPRLRGHLNPLLTPIAPSTQDSLPTSRKTKRGTTIISYAEDLLAGEDFNDSDGPRRLTGLRTRREDSAPNKEELVDKLTTELTNYVAVQGIWRDWMGKPRLARSDKQLHAQAGMPVTLVPIRVDLEIPSFVPPAALPLPADAPAFNVNPGLSAYKSPEATPAYRLKDFFMWNIYETLITPEQFATQLVNELDLPNPTSYIVEVTRQIRDQLHEHTGVALHSLFQTTASDSSRHPYQPGNPHYLPNYPPETKLASPDHNERTPPEDQTPSIMAPVRADGPGSESSNVLNPDDAYRCVISLNINILNRLYTDKFEWSLLHPNGFAENFAQQTCADVGLNGEWVPAISHAIYEAVSRLKKEACEGGTFGGEILNDAIEGQESGWRYEPETIAEDWEPKVEILSKDEIERREGDRERQLRRARRENARFSTTNVTGSGTPGYFDQPDPSDAPLGRGERSKKKRRFRSLSPLGRGATPNEMSGYVGSGGQLTDYERQNWRCANCLLPGSSAWTVRDGPVGARSLCNACGLYFDQQRHPPPWSKYLHAMKT